MAIEYTPTPVGSGYNLSNLNKNFTDIEAALQDALSRSGQTPNSMSSDLDMDSNDILNAGALEAQSLTLAGQTLQPGDAVTNGLLIDNALSEIAAAGLSATARSNLGLGSLATKSSVLRTDLNSALSSAITVSVKEYGASLNGVADDLPAFQAAYNAASNNSIITVPPGQLLLSGSIVTTTGKEVFWDCERLVYSDGVTPVSDGLPGTVRNTYQGRVIWFDNRSRGDLGTSFQMTKNANYTGGTAGFVNTLFNVGTTVQSTATAWEWNATFTLDNYAPTGENVGIYSQAKKRSTGATWGACIEIDDRTAVTANGATLGIEVTAKGNGLDPNYERNGVNVALHKSDAGTEDNQWGRGFWTSNNANAYIRLAFDNTSLFSGAVYHNSGAANDLNARFIKDEGSAPVGVDLTNATYSAGYALRIKQADKIGLDGTGTASINSNGSQIQLTGLRVYAEKGLAFPSSGNISSTATAGGSTLPSNPNGFLIITIDGSTQKIPYYSA